MDHKNEDFSESVSSFDFGAIFLCRLGHELSRNGIVVSIASFYKNLYCWIGPGMHHENGRNFEKMTFAKFKLNLVGPAGGSAVERASPPMWGETIRERNVYIYVYL